MPPTTTLLCDWTPQETLTLNAEALRRAAAGLRHWLEPLWPALCARARRPRVDRPPWPEVARRTVEEQYLVSLALDCAAHARLEIVRAVLMRHVVELLRAPPGRAEFCPDVDVRLGLVAAAAEADARVTANEKVN